jgi:hypothetical protein
MLKTKQFIHYFDFFAATTFHRFKGNDYYSSLTGGILSIILFVSFFTLFIYQCINSVNKGSISTEMISNYDEIQA